MFYPGGKLYPLGMNTASNCRPFALWIVEITSDMSSPFSSFDMGIIPERRRDFQCFIKLLKHTYGHDILTKCTREAVAKLQHSGLALQRQPRTAMERRPYPILQPPHTSKVLRSPQVGGEYIYIQPQEQRNGSDGWTRTSNSRINGAVPYHWATSEFVKTTFEVK